MEIVQLVAHVHLPRTEPESFRVLISLLIKDVNFEEGMNHLY
jgi:hypothetical protein